MPLVSAIIPTRGRPALLLRAVASVLSQTITDLELIVVVDGEDPVTAAALAGVTDPRLRIQVNPVSRGSGASRNLGAGLATGQWLGFLDDDDEWLPAKLERQLALVPDASTRTILTCRSAYTTPLGTSVRPREAYLPGTRFDEWLFDRRQLSGGGSFVQTSSLLLPRTLFQECGGFPAHGQHEDWEFVLTAVQGRGAALLTAPEILVRHYAEEERPSLTTSGPLDGSLSWIERMRPCISKRAYSGFCLTVVAHHAKRAGGWRRFATLLGLALRHGRPTAVQLLVFLIVCGAPKRLHKWLRRLRRPVVAAAT